MLKNFNLEFSLVIIFLHHIFIAHQWKSLDFQFFFAGAFAGGMVWCSRLLGSMGWTDGAGGDGAVDSFLILAATPVDLYKSLIFNI